MGKFGCAFFHLFNWPCTFWNRSDIWTLYAVKYTEYLVGHICCLNFLHFVYSSDISKDLNFRKLDLKALQNGKLGFMLLTWQWWWVAFSSESIPSWLPCKSLRIVLWVHCMEPGDGKEALELSYVTCIFGLKLFMFLLPREIYPSAWLQ